MELLAIAAFLKEVVQAELVYQKHDATGTLKDSVDVVVKEEAGVKVLEGYVVFYGRFVDTGRRREVTRVPVFALMEWIRQKNIASGDAEVKSAAFAIREKIYQEGIPTAESSRLAPRRTGFIDEALKTATPELLQMITQFDKELKTIQINNIITNVNKNLK